MPGDLNSYFLPGRGRYRAFRTQEQRTGQARTGAGGSQEAMLPSNIRGRFVPRDLNGYFILAGEGAELSEHRNRELGQARTGASGN